MSTKDGSLANGTDQIGKVFRVRCHGCGNVWCAASYSPNALLLRTPT